MIVLGSALLLLAVWCAVNLPLLSAGPSGGIAFVLGAFFGCLLILRAKVPSDERFGLSGRALGLIAVAGVVAVVLGVVIPLHQLEWIGVLSVFFACMAWALPRRYGRDLLLALFIIYWIHPLPGQILGPLQLQLQRMSVRLSEAALQVFGVNVWGDGLVLRTGLRVFGVPESCSGLKTAVTVLFCGLGTGLLMRLGWISLTALLGVGLCQVLILNVIRISGIVWLGKDRPAEWTDQVLHDTMSVFLLLGVGLIHLDAALIRQWLSRYHRKKALIEANDEIGEPEEKQRRWPRFWRIVLAIWKPVLVLLLVVVAGLFVSRRLRTPRRVEMIREVAEAMMGRDLINAERAVRAALTMAPEHQALKFDLALILLNQGRREEALAMLKQKPLDKLTLQERVLKARALLELKRLDELATVIKGFPPASRDLPGVAMVLAEFNAIIDQPAEVGVNVTKAAHGFGTQDRIRRLFPYMASRNLWESILEADSDLPYALPLFGVIAAEAHLRVNDVDGAANVLRRAMKGHKLDSVFMGPLVRVARERPGSEWVGQFAAVFKANLNRLTATELALAMDGSFAIGRPDLGWLAYCRMRSVAPEDPLLQIAPAEHARKWFAFRHDVLGMTRTTTDPTVDAKSFMLVARHFPPWNELWPLIPLADELGGGATKEGYQRRLRLCLESLKKIERDGKLDFRLQVLYGQVLGDLGQWNEAHTKLWQFEEKAPRRRRDFLLAHAALYKAQKEPELSYETLAEFMRLENHPPMTVWLDEANALMALGSGPYAMGIMEEARRDFPESGEWKLAMSGFWSYFGFAEEALFLVNGLSIPPPPAIKASLLLETGRIEAGKHIAVVENLADLDIPKQQTELLAPAEWAIEWRGGVLQERDYATEALAIPERKTPFFKALGEVKRAWFKARGAGESSSGNVWEAIGRDKHEKALALSELTLLLMRQGRMQDALGPARQALDLMPAWSLLWRLNVILHKDPDMVEQALKACPFDSEIWLAYLVTGIQHGKDTSWADKVVHQAVVAKQYPPATLVRAGDFLIRNEMTNAACETARAAIKDGQGLLPAYVLGIQCGIKTKNYQWALTCARNGAAQALEPWSFYKIIVGMKSASGAADPDVIRALEGLAAHYPSESIWAERLGEVYFQEGQTDRAVGVLQDAIAREGGKKQASPRTYLLAAEAARREGDTERAIRILRLARNLYPKDINVLNNLAYTLAQSPTTVKQAVELMPDLLHAGRDDFAVYDTAALVYLRSGDLKTAESYMSRALNLVKKGDYAWLEVYLNAAEAQIKMGKFREARDSLSLIVKTPERSPALDARARELQNEMARRERERQGWF